MGWVEEVKVGVGGRFKAVRTGIRVKTCLQANLLKMGFGPVADAITLLSLSSRRCPWDVALLRLFSSCSKILLAQPGDPTARYSDLIMPVRAGT